MPGPGRLSEGACVPTLTRLVADPRRCAMGLLALLASILLAAGPVPDIAAGPDRAGAASLRPAVLPGLVRVELPAALAAASGQDRADRAGPLDEPGHGAAAIAVLVVFLAVPPASAGSRRHLASLAHRAFRARAPPRL
jgi:hypothetical protein